MRIAALALLVSSCAAVQPPKGWFTCGWARFYDRQNAIAHPGLPRWADLRCGVDPFAVTVVAASRVEKNAAAQK